jgi:uncharacterized repeat protein (TIGR02543 family)
MLVGADGDATNKGAAWSYAIGVTYDGNGNTSGTVPASQLETIGFSVTLATNSGTLVKTGNTFAGWNTLANGTGTSYAEGAVITFDGSLPLYAQWTENNLNVTEFSNAKWSFYPNPVQEILTISLGNNSTIMGYEIFDISGKRIDFKSNHDSNIIKVSRFSRGVYFLKVQTDTGMLKAKFIKE